MVQDVKPGGVFMINCQWSDEELAHHLNAEAKKYIADNNIQLYTINAIDKAIEIGMGKRTNTILQSAFFKLADVMPIDEAVEFMKQAAKKSYSKKGDAVVEMNYKAIDAGVDAVHKVEVPDSWKILHQMLQLRRRQDVKRLLIWSISFLSRSPRWMVTAFRYPHLLILQMVSS